MSSELERVRSHFDERNPVLQLSLGALAMASKLDGLLKRYAVPTEQPAEPLPEALLAAVLGLIAVRDKLLETLGPAATSAPNRVAQPRRETAQSIHAESFLR